MTGKNGHRFCTIVPGFQEEGRIGSVVQGILQYCDVVVVVDDGSSDRTGADAEAAGAVVLTHETNRGKGASLNTGLEYACGENMEFVITMDGDGQHDPKDIPGFVKAFLEGGADVLVGTRMDNPVGMPLVRRLTNRFMSWLLSCSMKQSVPDTQCGFRLYSLDVVPAMPTGCDRFAAESEVLLDLSQRGVKIGSVPIRSIYGDEKSKINPLKDSARFIRMLWRYRRCRRRNAKENTECSRQPSGSPS